MMSFLAFRALTISVLRPMPKSPTLSPPQATAGSTDTSSFDIIPSRSSFSEPERAVRLPCYLLRPHTQNPMFHGRQDILTQVNIALALTLEGTHRASLTSLRSFALCGLGGVGKTQIAVEYAFSRKHSYDAVFWVQASSIAKLDESFTQISVELGLEDALKAGDRVVSRNIVMSWLANPIKNINSDENAATSQDKAITWLMVFDNADDLELLHDYWPTSKNGAVLVTSRDPLAKTNLYSRGGIDLEPLSTEDSASLLRKLTGHEQVLLDEGSSLAVSKRLGGLPLAISQAAAYIQRQDLTFSEFLDMYEVESIATEFQHVKIGYHQEYQHTLSTVWSFDSLSPDAKALLDVLSFLDPDCIDEVILTQGTSISVAKFPSTSASYMNSRTTLLKSSLVKRNKEHGQLLLHRLTQDAVRLSLPKDLSQKSFAAATNLAFDFWPIPKIPFSHNVGDWTPSQKVVPHALWLQNLFLGSKDLVVDVEVKKSLAHLLQKVGW